VLKKWIAPDSSGLRRGIKYASFTALLVLIGCLIAVTVGKGRLQSTPVTDIAAFDFAGKKIFPLRSTSKAVVFIFLSVDCPISNQYSPEIQRLATEFGAEGIKFWLVYPNADESPEVIRKHTQEFFHDLAVLCDSKHAVARMVHARVTPEAAVFLPGGELIYQGRIDDRYVDYGVQRPQAIRHDLEEILSAVAKGGKLKPTTTKAIGCPISD
jgi:hypothetical protein